MEMTMLFCRFILLTANIIFFSISVWAYNGSRNQWTSMTPICVSSNRGWPRSSKGPKGFEDLDRIAIIKRAVEKPGHSKAKLLVGATFSTEVHKELMIHLMIELDRFNVQNCKTLRLAVAWQKKTRTFQDVGILQHIATEYIKGSPRDKKTVKKADNVRFGGPTALP